MKKKIVWLVVSCLMVLSLVMASCGQPTTPTTPTTPETPTTPTTPETPTTPIAPAVEKPKYGGTLRVGWWVDIIDYDGFVGRPQSSYIQHITSEMLWNGDWTRGAAGGYGTNEASWAASLDVWSLNTGYVAESWELPSKKEGAAATIIVHIRHGIHYGLNPNSEASRLVGGRELTADDVLFSLSQVTKPGGSLYRTSPELKVAKFTAPDKWTVKIEVPWEILESAIGRFFSFTQIVPREVFDKWGDAAMADWRKNVGSGAFILTDFVPSSTATFVRNPNYWMKDPIGPGKGNQLPYMDGVKYFIIVDYSTRLAALRTAKVDWYCNGNDQFRIEEAADLRKTAPQLKSRGVPVNVADAAVALRTDKPPFNDIRVRRALMMATDFESIKRDLFGGEAQIITWPISYTPEFSGAYYGLDEKGQWPSDCPESTKELYTYNPEKAKQLLAEAGYPNGFKSNLKIESITEDIDYYSIIKDMWSKVGVDMALQPLETPVFVAQRLDQNFDQMAGFMNMKVSLVYRLQNLQGLGYLNQSRINDPVVNEAFPKIQLAAGLGNTVEANRLHKELMKYVLDQAWAIPRVIPYTTNFWWPWIRNYSGEVTLGYRHFGGWYRFVWLDQEMKKSMGY